MNSTRTVSVVCASMTIALLAPLGASAATTVSYLPSAPPCTTKDAQRPNNAALRPPPNWWMPPAQSQITTWLPRGQDVNDFPMLQTFPTVFMQPSDNAVTANSTTARPATFANGQKALPVSTCS